MSVLEWRHDQRRILLPILVLRPSGVDLTQVPATALVDTGATTSGIIKRIAQSLSLVSVGKRPLTSAQGIGFAARYAFRIGLPSDTGRLPYVFDEILGFELTGEASFSAVIGMDVLSQCDLSIMRNGQCRLAFGP